MTDNERQELQTLRLENAELQKTNTDLHRKNVDLQAHKRSLGDEVARLRGVLHRTNQEDEDLMDELHTELAYLRGCLVIAREDAEGYRAAWEVARDELRDAELMCSGLNAEIVGHKAAAQEMKAHIADLLNEKRARVASPVDSSRVGVLGTDPVERRLMAISRLVAESTPAEKDAIVEGFEFPEEEIEAMAVQMEREQVIQYGQRRVGVRRQGRGE